MWSENIIAGWLICQWDELLFPASIQMVLFMSGVWIKHSRADVNGCCWWLHFVLMKGNFHNGHYTNKNTVPAMKVVSHSSRQLPHNVDFQIYREIFTSERFLNPQSVIWKRNPGQLPILGCTFLQIPTDCNRFPKLKRTQKSQIMPNHLKKASIGLRVHNSVKKKTLPHSSCGLAKETCCISDICT